MTATEVNPPKVREVAPKEMLVVPIVNDELVNAEFGMLVSVLVEPLIDAPV